MLTLQTQRHRRGKALTEESQALLLALHLAGGGKGDALLEVVQQGELLQLVLKDESSSRRRSLDRGMRHMVEHRLVAVVPHTYYNRQRMLSHACCQGIGVVVGKVARGTTATYYHHGIPAVGLVGYLHQCGRDALRHMLPLHYGRKELHTEGQPPLVFQQLAAEVAITSRRGTGHHGNALEQGGHGQVLVVVDDAVLLQLVQYLLPATCLVAQGVGAVYVDDIKCIAIEFAKGDFHLQEHLYAGTQALPRLCLETKGKHIVDTRPDGDAGLCHYGTAEFVLLHQFAIEMSAISCPALQQFAMHPIGILGTPLYEGAHYGIEFEE